jgi:antitoxin (DNA-binding transcriptional repressor) of toxin-antitoxin stability system
MKLVSLENAILDICVRDAQHERVVITSEGKPVALIVGVEGMDEEQLELGASDKFWNLITERRNQDTISRADLELEIRE